MRYNNNMKYEYAHLRIWKKTLVTLRMIFALTGESIISIVDRLADEELARIKSDEQKTA